MSAGLDAEQSTIPCNIFDESYHCKVGINVGLNTVLDITFNILNFLLILTYSPRGDPRPHTQLVKVDRTKTNLTNWGFHHGMNYNYVQACLAPNTLVKCSFSMVQTCIYRGETSEPDAFAKPWFTLKYGSLNRTENCLTCQINTTALIAIDYKIGPVLQSSTSFSLFFEKRSTAFKNCWLLFPSINASSQGRCIANGGQGRRPT